jgi:hypothetical protein
MAKFTLRDDWKPGHFEAHVCDKGGRIMFQSGLHTTRVMAALEAFQAMPRAASVTTGGGYHGGANIQWMTRQAALDAVQ